MTIQEMAYQKHCEAKPIDLEIDIHRRILTFLNEAVQPEDLMYEKMATVHAKHGPVPEDHPEDMRMPRKQILDATIAHEIIAFRDREYPLGFRHLKEALASQLLDHGSVEMLLHHFSPMFYGRWREFPQRIPRRGPGGYDGVVHAALLHTGKVLFITADETTLLWNPQDTTPATFADPLNQPHTMPGGYSQICGHHVFLSDGKLLSVGGGGYLPNPLASWGYKFDPTTSTWARTSNSMSEAKWYPTAVALGNRKVLVTGGNGMIGHMDIYDEATDTFSEVTSGDDMAFPNLYPGLHLLPNRVIFYSRTGWGWSGPGGGPFTGDDQSAYFTLTGTNTGVWTNIAPPLSFSPDRTKGMSVLVLSNTPPHVQILVLGGADPSTNNTYEMIDASTLSPLGNWGPTTAFPDGEHRSLCSGVLLPDGNVFVCGGIPRTNSPCAMFNPQTNTWSPMAALPSIRDYHSVALLLPSGRVAMAGWNNTAIEIYRPPYLFRGPRPVISSAPASVHHGRSFVIESPDAASILKAVLVRPMAVTHQTDSEQKVVELPRSYDPADPTRLTLTVPSGSHPHSLLQRGYYMLFALNTNGVPSMAKWIYVR